MKKPEYKTKTYRGYEIQMEKRFEGSKPYVHTSILGKYARKFTYSKGIIALRVFNTKDFDIATKKAKDWIDKKLKL